MLLALPIDVTEMRDKITAKLPLDSLCEEDPIDIKTISGLLLLLRKHFGFKPHASGQLFYVRAVGISELVVDWVFHFPKVVYASLLYGLVRRTCLPFSYIKEHYNLGVYAFVSNVITSARD